ncbi:MAG: NADH-quinone oxidoreductase subunit L [Fibrobacter sp.]|nr:NADH-quinone oxidoreductase subunit L [Fibrobacter sp.]
MIPLWLIPLFPLLGAIILGIISLASSDSQKGAPEFLLGFIGLLFPLLSFMAVLSLSFGGANTPIQETLGTWIDISFLQIQFGFLFDSLSKMMLLFVTGIGSLITWYSIGYMKHDRGFARFFAYMNFFLFSMIILVLADSLPLTFLGWEGVGLCSYLLIGFWHKDSQNAIAGNKAFIVNRVGDIGFLIAMLVLLSVGGSAFLSYEGLNAGLAGLSQAELVKIIPALALAAFFFFFGCTGKSAQIPLLTWLPDAMAGPTPVSALIHAATMVTSGVYLLARLSNLFVLVPSVLSIVLWIGLLTAFWAAVAGLFQNDIKKVLAYSTISQLGFMFMAAGVAAFDVAIFHVFTHAFFKAALFLGAGAVIHSLSGEQDMRKMGGLIQKMPITAIVMLFGFFAIIGFPGFAGFWSKDLILEKLFEFGAMGPYLYAFALLTAVLTAVYMGRLIIMTFFGSYRGSLEKSESIHDPSFSMLVPMLILTIGSAFAGYLWATLIPGANWFEQTLAPVLSSAQNHIHVQSVIHLSPLVFALVGTVAAFFGLFLAWFIFNRPVPLSKDSSDPKGFGASWTFLWDTIHQWTSVFLVKMASWFMSVVVNHFVLFVQWLLVGIVEILSDGARAIQVRKVRLQMGLSFVGILFVILIVYVYGGAV